MLYPLHYQLALVKKVGISEANSGIAQTPVTEQDLTFIIQPNLQKNNQGSPKSKRNLQFCHSSVNRAFQLTDKEKNSAATYYCFRHRSRICRAQTEVKGSNQTVLWIRHCRSPESLHVPRLSLRSQNSTTFSPSRKQQQNQPKHSLQKHDRTQPSHPSLKSGSRLEEQFF